MGFFHSSCERGARSARAMRYLCAFALVSIASNGFASAGTLPVGWSVANVGSPAASGSASTLVCSYKTTCLGFAITGVGADVGGTRDQFTFVYRQLTGDGTIIGRLASLDNTDPLIEAGLMVRSSLGADSAHAFAAISAAKGVVFDRRVLTGGATDSTAGGFRATPVWLRIDRRASSLTAYQSLDGVAWTMIGSQSISLPLTIYVGVAVASHNASLTAKASVTNVSVIETPLPVGWASSVIGAPPVSGYSVPSGYSLVVAGAGADIHGVSDQFRYTYMSVSGDVDVSARVVSVQSVDSWSKGGVMIRTSLNADAPHALMLVSAGRGLAFRRRPAAGYSTLETSAGSGTAPVWVKLERRGSAVTAFRSADGATWSMIGSQTLDLPSTFYVGLAATSQVPSVAAAAVFDNVVVRAVASAPNSPPVVSLTSPSDGAVVAPSTPLSISASASDSDGTIKSVDLYVDGVKIASDTTSPYTFTWSSAATGAHTVKVVANDDDGASATSASRTVTVRTPGVPAARYAVFEPSVDHVNVDTYLLEIYTAGTVRSLLTTHNLGKPIVESGECKADVTAVVASLPAGSYVAVVKAVNTSFSVPSLPSPAFTR